MKITKNELKIFFWYTWLAISSWYIFISVREFFSSLLPINDIYIGIGGMIIYFTFNNYKG